MDVEHEDKGLERLEFEAPFNAGLDQALVKAFRKVMQWIRLAPDEREIVIMRVELHYDYARIAEELDRPNAAAARAFLNRTLLKLARMMQVTRD